MSLLQTTLSTQLQNLTPTDTEGVAITRLVDAYGVYATDATANSVPITPAGIALGKVAMSAALPGMNSASAAAAKIEQGLIAFWVAISGGLATSFVGAIAITPPPHVGVGAALAATFAANIAAEASLIDAVDAIATLLHGQALTGGTVTFTGPSGPFPIL